MPPQNTSLEQSEQEQEPSKVLNLFRKSLFHIILGWDQSCCDLWSGDVYFTKTTDCPRPVPQTWPRPCWKHAPIVVKSNAPTSLSIYPLWTAEKRAKEALLRKGLEESSEKHNLQYGTADAFRCGGHHEGASPKACFSERTQLCRCSLLSSKESMKTHSLPVRDISNNISIEFVI